MKIILSLLLSLFTFTLHAEKYPILLEASVDIPDSTNGGTVINITTNVYFLINSNTYVTNLTFVTSNTYVTNITMVVVTNAPTPIVILKDNVVDARLGTRLQRNIGAPTTFTFAGFTTDSFTTLYIKNPTASKLTFPATGVWWARPAPTNQTRVVILFEWVSGEYWASPDY